MYLKTNKEQPKHVTGLDWDLDQFCPKSSLFPSRMKSTKIHIWTEFPLANKSMIYLRFTHLQNIPD